MNLAFYLLFSGLLLIAWLVVVLGSDRFTYWEFGPSSIAMKHRFSEGAESYTSPQVQTSRQSDWAAWCLLPMMSSSLPRKI